MEWRPAQRADAILAGLWAAAALALAAARPLVPSLGELVPACWFRGLTGLPCATCGSTHAALALADGRWAAALATNPLAAAAAVLFVVGGLAAPLWLAAVKRIPAMPRVLPLPVRLATAAALLGNWLFVLLRSP